MKIQSRENRNLIISFFVGLIPEILIATAVALVSDDGEAFLITFLGLYLIYFLIWLKNSAWAWIVYYYSRKSASAQSLEHLEKMKYPLPEECIGSSTEYLQSVIANEEVPLETRLDAAINLGSYQYPKTSMRLQEFLRMTLILEKGIESYRSKYLSTLKPLNTTDEKEIDEDEDHDDNIEKIIDSEFPELDETTERKYAGIIRVIKFKCRHAESFIKGIDGSGSEHDRYETEQLEEYLSTCLNEAEKIEDAFYKSAALHPIADLISTAGQYERAERLIEMIPVDIIQEEAKNFLIEKKQGKK